MKFGDQLEFESVPQWSLHNLDYNSLKHEIKMHTTRDQATAIAIPGHQDVALRRFEDRLYSELCGQHDRVDLFVASKADEISRRLDHLASSISRWAGKTPSSTTDRDSIKLQKRFNKYERELLRCGEDIQSLSRFASAQIVAFRKIVKKYRKWTGSTTLGSRFNETVLSNPKSFTRRDFTPLQVRYDEVSARLRSVTPYMSEPSSPSTDASRPGTSSELNTQDNAILLPPPRVRIQDELPETVEERVRAPRRSSPKAAQHVPTAKYWNEYDNGSETGECEDDYAIYINPDDFTSFPGLKEMQSAWTGSIGKAKKWLGFKANPERQPLLEASKGSDTFRGYASTATDSDEEGGYTSSFQDLPSHNYAAYYAFPSVQEQKINRYRERALFWATIGCFLMSFVLLGIAGVLITTGRHKLRVEVDAVASVGVVMSLFCACAGLGSTFYRRDDLSLSYRMMVGASFVTSCILNGMLLILIVGNAP